MSERGIFFVMEVKRKRDYPIDSIIDHEVGSVSRWDYRGIEDVRRKKG